MSGRVITFYSYKGGVGRTFLLANVAVWLARIGFKVLCVDWDLEAPGLHHYFDSRGMLPKGPRTGLVDYLASVKGKKDLAWSRITRQLNLPGGKGTISFVDAGDPSTSEYGRALADVSWSDLYSEEHQLGEKLEQLRKDWTQRYDFVFLDSRTGLTDIGGVCTAQLPDIVVLVFAPNMQGLDGTLDVVRKARAQRSLLPISRGGFLVLPIPSRFDPSAAGDEPEKWRRILAERLQPLYDEWREKDVSPEALAPLLRVPYVGQWSFGEPLPVLDESGDDPSTVSYAITTIASFLAKGLMESRRLVEERPRYVEEVVERNRALLGHKVGATEGTTPFTYDIFLSFTSPDRELARALAAELADRGRKVFFDEQSITAGDRWITALQRGLREARGLVTILGPTPSSWQNAEIDAFLPLADMDDSRFIMPVWRTEPVNRPDIALQGIPSAQRSPAQIASDIHETLARRDRQRSVPTQAEARQHERLWTEKEAIAAYLEWVTKQHERLFPYFPGASDMFLEQVYVDIALDPSAPGNLAAMKADASPQHVDLLPGERVKRPEESMKPRSLEELLLQRDSHQPAARWIVIGEPGAGKTTLARSLARSTAKQGKVVPIFVSLPRMKSGIDPINFAVADMLGSDEPHSVRAIVLRKALHTRERKGELLVLFDGVDELAAGRVDEILEGITAYAAEKTNTPVALMGRPIAFERRELPAVFHRARVLPLQPPKQDDLLSRLLGEGEAKRVRTHLGRHVALAELASSPLLLTLIAVVARDTLLAEAQLPGTRSKLYATAIDLLLRRGFGSTKRGVRDTQPARRLLQLLSLQLHEEGGESWTREALAEHVSRLRQRLEEANFLVKETWGSNDEFLEDIGSNAGILGPHDGPQMPWRYLHRSMREFLAAEELAKRPRRELEEHIESIAASIEAVIDDSIDAQESTTDEQPNSTQDKPDPMRWGEVYALVCGLIAKPEGIVRQLDHVSPELARRTVLSIDALSPERLLDTFLGLSQWEPEDLHQLMSDWAVAEIETMEMLGSRLTSKLNTRALARIWFVLDTKGASPERIELFARCGRGLPPANLVSFVSIPGGRFMMGTPGSEGFHDERPAHPRLVHAFQLAATPITRAQYQAFDPTQVRSVEQENDLPMVDVAWYEARLFCHWLGARLPSEAEWEYACRAGTTSKYWSGDKEEDLAKVGWYSANSGGRIHPVGQKPPSPWRIHDMHGNVWEWCEDSWHDSYYGAPDDARAWFTEASEFRVVRGGSYLNDAKNARSAYRDGSRPSKRWNNVGFRPARSVTT